MTSLNRRQFTRSLLAVPAAALVGTGLGALAPAAASAAPADWNAHFLTNSNHDLVHQVRNGDGTWKPSWSEVGGLTGTLYRVSCVGLAKDLHVVAALNSGPLDHAVRNRADGSWSAFTPIPSASGPVTGAPHVAVTSLGNELHVFSASEQGDSLYHTVRYADGTWQQSWKLLRDFGQQISQIATTRVGTTIDTAVIAGGKLLHAIRATDGTWSNWGNIASAAGGFVDVPHRVALAGIGSSLHVVALNGSKAGAFHTIRKSDGSWQQFRKVAVFNDYWPSDVCAANVGGELQVGIIHINFGVDQTIRHTIRRADGTWQPVRAVPTSGLTGNPGILAMAGTL